MKNRDKNSYYNLNKKYPKGGIFGFFILSNIFPAPVYLNKGDHFIP